MLKSFLFELLINLVQPIPNFEMTAEYNNSQMLVIISLSHCAMIIMVFRIYLTYKLLNHYNTWTNPRSKRIG